MYTIYIEDFRVFAIIGILPKERKKPQEIIVNCEIGYEKESDEFINYADVVNLIENMLVKEKYALIEDALDDIIENLAKNFNQIKNVKLKLLKPQILDNCTVGVSHFRNF